MRATLRVLQILLLGLASGCGGTASDPVSVRSAGVEMSVSVDPARPRVGDNSIWLDLRDDGDLGRQPDAAVPRAAHVLGVGAAGDWLSGAARKDPRV